MKELKEFVLLLESGRTSTTRHTSIEEAKNCYLKNQVRMDDGTLDLCVQVVDKNLAEMVKVDRDFILSAVSLNLYDYIKKNHSWFIEGNGLQPYYDLCVTLTDQMIFCEDSMYMRFLDFKTNDKGYQFTYLANDCIDWYYMSLADRMITDNLLNSILFGDTN